MYLRILSLAILVVSLLGSTASAQLINFFEDFENLDRTSPTALSDAGWQGAAAGLTPSGRFEFFASFVAPNNIDGPQLSVISDTDGGEPPVGEQGLLVFSDYNSRYPLWQRHFFVVDYQYFPRADNFGC